MKAFTYERPATVRDAARLAAERPNAKFIAGGTNLLDLMKLQVETPTTLIDVNRLPLDTVEATSGGGLRIGALVRNSDLAADPRVRKDYAVLAKALLAGASGQLRNKATKKLVYQWTIAPPARSLPARGSASFNSAEVDIPQGGDELTVTLEGQAG